MRIAYLTTSVLPSRNANAVHVMRMAAAYESLGHRVVVWTPRRREWEERGVLDLSAFYGLDREVRVRRLPAPRRGPMRALALAVWMPFLARLGGADLVHSRTVAGAWGATRAGCRTVLELHDLPPRDGRRLRLYAATLASRRCRGVVCITGALRDALAGLGPAPGSVLVAPDGVPAAWLEEHESREEARAALGWPAGTTVVYTGSFYPGRGVEVLLEVAARLPQMRFVLAGGRDGEVEPFREPAARAGNVELLGFRPPAEIRRLLAAADVLVMPYQERVAASGGGDIARFTSPLKMFEYLAAGRPVVASDLPVLREVLAHEGNALLVEPSSVAAWCGALRRIESDGDLARRLSAAATVSAREYTWERRAQKILEFAGCTREAEAVP